MLPTVDSQPATSTEFQPERRPVNFRSIALGLLGVLFVCGITPFNDYVVGNTFFVGNFLPIGVVLFFFLFVLLINAPLHLIGPRVALSGRELAVALGMTLVSCGLPSSGLMRYLPADLVGQRYLAHGNGTYRKLLTDANTSLPEWMYPAPEDKKVETHVDGKTVQVDVYSDYWNRISLPDKTPDTFLNRIRVVPWWVWARFSLVWGVLVAAVFGGILCLSILVRRQWVQNERLAFPLATVYVALIESPKPGRALSPLFRSPTFWIAFAGVFFIHIMNGLNAYFPTVVPKIPIRFDLTSVFTEEPWRSLHPFVKTATIFFSIVGITFFVQTKIAFSLWFFMIMWQVAQVSYHSAGSEWPWSSQQDQFFGGIIPYALSILWVGRKEWLLILKQMARGARPDEATERYLPYPIAGWGLVACVLVASVWLLHAGMTVPGVIVFVAMMLLILLFLMRVVAETGLIFVQTNMDVSRPWIFALNYLPAAISRTSDRSYLIGNVIGTIFGHDMRESLAVFAPHAMRIADLEAYEKPRPVRRAIPFTLSLILALVVGYFVSGISTLYCNYSYSSTVDTNQVSPINKYGTQDSTVGKVLDPSIQYLAPPPGSPTRGGPQEPHSRIGWFLFGVIFTAFLSIMRLIFVNWPLHPIGYLLVYSYPMWNIWFSIFLGWLAKVLIVRFGGSDLYRAARNIFIGMIFGEAGAAACWLIVTLVMRWHQLDYKAINLLPT